MGVEAVEGTSKGGGGAGKRGGGRGQTWRGGEARPASHPTTTTATPLLPPPASRPSPRWRHTRRSYKTCSPDHHHTGGSAGGAKLLAGAK